MNILFLVQASTGMFDCTSTRIVAAWPTLAQAEQHRAAVQAQADARISKSDAEGNGGHVDEVTELDLNMEIRDGVCSYSIEAVLAPQSEEVIGNFLKYGALLGQAQAEVEQNRRRYDKRYAQMMAKFEAKKAPAPPQVRATGTFADKLGSALQQ